MRHLCEYKVHTTATNIAVNSAACTQSLLYKSLCIITSSSSHHAGGSKRWPTDEHSLVCTPLGCPWKQWSLPGLVQTLQEGAWKSVRLKRNNTMHWFSVNVEPVEFDLCLSVYSCRAISGKKIWNSECRGALCFVDFKDTFQVLWKMENRMTMQWGQSIRLQCSSFNNQITLGGIKIYPPVGAYPDLKLE